MNQSKFLVKKEKKNIKVKNCPQPKIEKILTKNESPVVKITVDDKPPGLIKKKIPMGTNPETSLKKKSIPLKESPFDKASTNPFDEVSTNPFDEVSTNPFDEVSTNPFDEVSPDLVEDCIAIISECDPEQNCSKNELIGKIAYQRKLLLKETNGERTKKIIAMEKVLTDLNEEWRKITINNMNQIREKQNQYVLKNKMEPKMFTQKIDLTGEKKPGDNDGIRVVEDSRKFWVRESKKRPQKPPPEKEQLFRKTKGNQKLPRELLKILT